MSSSVSSSSNAVKDAEICYEWDHTPDTKNGVKTTSYVLKPKSQKRLMDYRLARDPRACVGMVVL